MDHNPKTDRSGVLLTMWMRRMAQLYAGNSFNASRDLTLL